MFDARIRVDSIRLFVFMERCRVTRSFLSRWRTKRTFYSICKKMLSKLSLHQSGKEIKLGQGDGLTKTDICKVAKTSQKKSGQGVSENYKSGWIY